MNKKTFKKIIFILLITIFVLMVMSLKSKAASISISTSKSSVSPGESFTVTVTANGGAGKVSTSVSNGSGGKTDFLDNGSYSFSCTAGTSGSVSIYASGTIADYTTEEDESRSASKTVSIVKPETPSGNSGSSSSSGTSSSGKSNSGSSSTQNKTTSNTNTNTNTEKQLSSDSSLSSLAVAEGALNPEFSKDIKEYTLSVPNEVTKINIAATTSDRKASYSLSGNEELQEGENNVVITVKAEDGSTTTYTIVVTREKAPLAMKELKLSYIDQEGKIVNIGLTPQFKADVLEYTIEDIEYWVQKLNIEAIANIEGATIEIQGNDELVTGENIIKIVLKLENQSEEETEENQIEDEIITYTIKFNKKEEPVPPTLMGRIKNWFGGIFGTVSNWYNNNQEKVLFSSIVLCIVALFGLSIYIVVDYKKYKTLLEKVRTLTSINNSEKIADTEEISQNIQNDYSSEENIEQEEEKEVKAKGRHF